MLQEKNREVEWLRAQKAADDVIDVSICRSSVIRHVHGLR